MLSTGPINGLMVFGLWWPWGDGETTSLRVGLADVEQRRPAVDHLLGLGGGDLSDLGLGRVEEVAEVRHRHAPESDRRPPVGGVTG